jgi:hypothetical protein
MTDTASVTGSRPSWLTHPILAWRTYETALADRADAEAVTAGLTGEDLGRGVRRYRDPRLDQLAAHRARPVAAPDHADWSDDTAFVPPEWSPVRHVTAAGGVVAVSPQRVSRIAVGVCLDCAADLRVDEATGALVDRWGQATCGASYRAHSPDLPAVDAGPAAPATGMTDRRTQRDGLHLLAGAGAIPPPTVPPQGHSGFASVSHATALRAALDPGHPAAAVSGAPAGSREEHAPARLPSGPAKPPGGAR